MIEEILNWIKGITVDFNSIFTELIKVAIIASISGFWAYFKGRKVSTNSIERKETIYLPLINELALDSIQKNKNQISFCLLEEITTNNYKYEIEPKVLKKIKKLSSLLKQYNSINLRSIAHNILVEQFVIEYEKKFETIIDGVVHHSLPNGAEYDEEIEVPELQILKHYIRDEQLDELIYKDYDDYEYYPLDDDYECLYLNDALVNIFEYAFHSSCEIGKSNKHSVNDWNGTVAEYMAYNVPFRTEFDSNNKVIDKNNLFLLIDNLKSEIVDDLKDIVSKIVKKYEREVI